MQYNCLHELLNNSSSTRDFFLSLGVPMQMQLHEHGNSIHSAHQLHELVNSLQKYNHAVEISDSLNKRF